MEEMIKTTEVTSYEIESDNVLNQRLFFAYQTSAAQVKGKMLEVGCGTGKGLEIFPTYCDHYTAIDKNPKLIQYLAAKYPKYTFMNQRIPPFVGIADNTFDTLVTQQVIEHIQDDHLFVKEIHRVLKPNGKAIITTPNIKHTLTRNPWHVREYTADELRKLVGTYFQKIDMKGVRGSANVMAYHEENRKSVQKITRWDIFNFQYNLPRFMLQVPYEILNRLNRNRLLEQDSELVKSVRLEDFSLDNDPEKCLDLYCILEK